MLSTRLAEIIGIQHRNVKEALRRYFDPQTLTLSIKRTKGRPLHAFDLTKRQIAVVASRSNRMTPDSIKTLANEAGVSVGDCRHVAQIRQESQAFDALRTLSSGYGLSLVRQFGLAGRNIDFLISGCSLPADIAVEYDEHHHKYTAGGDTIRESEIVAAHACPLVFHRIREGQEMAGIAELACMIYSMMSKTNFS